MSMKVKGDGGRDLRISFQHGLTTVKVGKNVGKEKRFIQSMILLGEEKEEIEELTCLGQGVSVCAFSDQFNPEEGRQIALHRAIDAALLAGKISEGERAALLKGYFTRPRGKRERKKEILAEAGGEAA